MAFDLWETPKDPDETRDYERNWINDIGSATIVSSSWSATSLDITIVSDTHDETKTVVRLAGGIANNNYDIRNIVILSDGEIGVRTMTLQVQDL